MGAHVSVPMYRRSLPQRLQLEGRACCDCGAVAFPPRAACRVCRSAHLTFRELSGRGTITAITTIAGAGAPPEFAEFARRGGPYYVAIVHLEEGPSVTGQVVLNDRSPRIGDTVMAVVRRLYEEEEVIRYGFKFDLVLDEDA